MNQYLSNDYTIELIGFPLQKNTASSLRLTKRLLWLSVLTLAAAALLIMPAEANPQAQPAGTTPAPVMIIAGPECIDTACSQEYSSVALAGITTRLSAADRDSLALLDGTPLQEAKAAIAQAAYKHQVPAGFFTGIAYAESSAHEHYYIESDKESCHNPWGLKPKSGQRSDGSYLICFSSWEESSDYLGGLLREKYFDRGAKTVEAIAPYYKCGGHDGADWCLSTMNNWIRNVNTYSYF